MFRNNSVSLPCAAGAEAAVSLQEESKGSYKINLPSRKISLRTRTLDNRKQKVNDALGHLAGDVILRSTVRRILSNSFAFGGSNASIILGKT